MESILIGDQVSLNSPSLSYQTQSLDLSDNSRNEASANLGRKTGKETIINCCTQPSHFCSITTVQFNHSIIPAVLYRPEQFVRENQREKKRAMKNKEHSRQFRNEDVEMFGL